MNQQQSIGNSNQHKGLPDEKNEQTSPGSKPAPNNQQSGKPAVTDDSGNQVDKLTGDAGNGYSERKPTEAHSDVAETGDTRSSEAPQRQGKETEKAYGAGAENEASNKQHSS